MLLSSEKSSAAALKLVDFGSAQVSVEDETGKEAPKRVAAATPAYSPPEFLEEREESILEPSFDMWAVGVILYIMLTGTISRRLGRPSPLCWLHSH